MIVNHSQDQNSSWSEIGRIHKRVVRVVRIIGCNLDLHASMIASLSSILCDLFTTTLSIKTMASLTTIHVRAINPIAKGILYGFPVIASPIFTHNSAQKTAYIITTGFLNELNCNSKMVKIKKNAIKNQRIVALIRSAFSCVSHQATNDIPSGSDCWETRCVISFCITLHCLENDSSRSASIVTVMFVSSLVICATAFSTS